MVAAAAAAAEQEAVAMDDVGAAVHEEQEWKVLVAMDAHVPVLVVVVEEVKALAATEWASATAAAAATA